MPAARYNGIFLIFPAEHCTFFGITVRFSINFLCLLLVLLVSRVLLGLYFAFSSFLFFHFLVLRFYLILFFTLSCSVIFRFCYLRLSCNLFLLVAISPQLQHYADLTIFFLACAVLVTPTTPKLWVCVYTTAKVVS